MNKDLDRCLSFGQLIVLNMASTALCFMLGRVAGFGAWGSIGLGYAAGAVLTIALAAALVTLISHGLLPMRQAVGATDESRFAPWDVDGASSRFMASQGGAATDGFGSWLGPEADGPTERRTGTR